MPYRISVHKHGGPEVLCLERGDLPPPGPGEVRLSHRAIGVNFIDVYFRSGLYKPPGLPFVPGNEAVGCVEAVGASVEGVKVGDRVAYTGPIGSYCEARNIGAEHLIALPSRLSDDEAAAMMLKGLTAQYLLRQTYLVGPKTTLLFHAAAGGVGSIACGWAKALGARVIGTVGSEEKAERARVQGCDEVIVYRRENFVERVKQITDGALCDVVYDSVGRATFPDSLDCLRPRGTFVSFGNASGAVEAFDLGLLARKGSLFATRPMLGAYADSPARRSAMAEELFDAHAKGYFQVRIGRRYLLSEAGKAHQALESRATLGSSLIYPHRAS